MLSVELEDDFDATSTCPSASCCCSRFPTYDNFYPGNKDWKAIERTGQHW